MDTRKIASEYRMAQWAQIVRERSEKGLTIRSYCEEKGIHENTYFYWQRKLREAAGEQAGSLSVVNAPLPKGWAELSVREELSHARRSPGEGLIVELGDCRVLVQTDTDINLLARVCRTLKAL